MCSGSGKVKKFEGGEEEKVSVSVYTVTSMEHDYRYNS